MCHVRCTVGLSDLIVARLSSASPMCSGVSKGGPGPQSPNKNLVWYQFHKNIYFILLFRSQNCTWKRAKIITIGFPTVTEWIRLSAGIRPGPGWGAPDASRIRFLSTRKWNFLATPYSPSPVNAIGVVLWKRHWACACSFTRLSTSPVQATSVLLTDVAL